MRPIFTFLMLIMAASCSGACATGKNVALVGGHREADTYPMWTAAQLPDGPAAAKELPPPATTATAITANYLIATMDGMSKEVWSFEASPIVYLRDGRRWLTGRYVDRISSLHLAFIRVEETLPATRLAKNAGQMMSLAGLVESSGRDMVLAAECPEVQRKIIVSMTQRSSLTICAMTRSADLREGAVFLDREGDIIGLVTVKLPGNVYAGIGVEDIRRWLDIYFMTGGKDISPKPEY